MKKLNLKLSAIIIAITTLLSCDSGENDNNTNNLPNTSLPEIMTLGVNNITLNSATIGGKILNDGGATIIKKGIVWDINPNPTINLTSKTDEGKGVDDFTSNLTNLLSGTTYFYRAYSTNSVGTSYSNEYFFKTNSLATLTTNTIVNITKNSATVVGKMISYGYSQFYEPILNRGVVWSTSQNPTIDLTTKTVGIAGLDAAGIINETFSCELTGLNQNTSYYARTYLTTKMGTAYGEQQSFTTTTIGIGDNYQGGIIGYLFRSGDSGYIQGQLHGLILAPKDLSDAQFTCDQESLIILHGKTSNSIGAGNTNTIAILNNIYSPTYCPAIIAAKLCYDLEVNGYSDWYLPSSYDMFAIKKNLTSSMIFLSDKPYWSSTGKNDVYPNPVVAAMYQGGDNTFIRYDYKCHVRAVRTF